MNGTIEPADHPQAEPTPRPVSLTVVAWFEIVGGLHGIYSIWSQFRPQVPRDLLAARIDLYPSLSPHTLLLFGVLNGLIGLIIGVGLLRRVPWVRGLFVAAAIESMVLLMADMKYGLFTFIMMATVVPVSLVIAYLLYRQPASGYFSGTQGARSV
jgi:hypothetical protein